ncbi:hypothetical protein ACJJIL_21520 [Microbulbifer sp. EKSA005]|uniref:hypothetical protein n=1 Tax=Microbulbifer sp. EKSA005 TaxID=3243364 RepID=UPI004042ADE6
MKTYQINYDVNNYRQLAWSDKDINILKESEVLLSGDKGALKKISVEWMIEEGVTNLPKPDIAYLQGYTPSIIVNSKVAPLLSDKFGDKAENITISIENEFWFIFKINKISDTALNLERCKFKLRRSGSFGRITKAVYNKSEFSDSMAIIAKQDPMNIVVTDEFKDFINSNQFTGLSFKEVENI